MRLTTIGLPTGGTSAARLDGSTWTRLPFDSLDALLRSPDPTGAARGRGTQLVPGVATPLSPVIRPSKVLCVGHNYRAHILEMGHEIPTSPTLFAKHADTLLAPGAPLRLPSGVSDRVDWEGELAVIVGGHLHRATADEAEAAIAGYTVANDISLRDWQRRGSQWLPGKMFDSTTPLGPVMVTPDEFRPSDGVGLRTWVDGELVQHGDLGDLVFPVPVLLADISQITRLGPGDVVLTGTPSGVGDAREPRRYLAHGETVEVEIDGIGRISTTYEITD
jgi:acylpyruvate hydrolase